MKKLFSTNAFSRSGFSTISEKTFFTSLAAFVIYGLLSTFVGTLLAPVTLPTVATVVLCIIPFIGCFVAMNDNIGVSFLGYNLITVPFGFLLAPALNHYSPDVVAHATLITAFITGLMGFAGITYPNLFRSLGGTLFYCLLGLVMVRILAIFIPAFNLTIIDYFSAGLFSLYIGYDMFRASEASRTFGSSLKIAVSLYLDILNLFLRILSILGNDND
jgi:FtsH-binding integral membrane protein